MPVRTSSTLVNNTALTLLLVHLIEASKLWHISVDEAPAPLTQAGPPFSFHATRDRSLLPGQICGIVAAYFGTILIIGALFLTVGRRLRSEAQSSQSTLGMELVKSSNKNFEPSPISPNSAQRPWYSPKRSKSKTSARISVRSGIEASSPVPESIASFDAKVIEADKYARQQEMERLYEAVMRRDEEEDDKSQPLVSNVDLSRPQHPVRSAKMKPPRLITDAPAMQHLRADQVSPVSPVNTRSPVRAIYPPDASLPPGPVTPTSPIQAKASRTTNATHHPPSAYERAMRMHQDPVPQQVSRSPSVVSQESTYNRPKKLRRSLQRIKIGTPTQTYPSQEDSDSARTPLTPRWYPKSELPPSPPTRSEAPTTPATYRSHGQQSENEEARFSNAAGIPQPAPQRMAGYYNDSQPQTITNARHVRLSLPTSPRAYKTNSPGLDSAYASAGPYQTPRSNVSNGTIGTLPFREIHPSTALRSPGLQTTYLERRRDLLNPPRTGQATPYSPYMPFTPLTPVTPHLTSRAERRQREREEGRRVLRQQDVVIDENEMWGNAY